MANAFIVVLHALPVAMALFQGVYNEKKIMYCQKTENESNLLTAGTYVIVHNTMTFRWQNAKTALNPVQLAQVALIQSAHHAIVGIYFHIADNVFQINKSKMMVTVEVVGEMTKEFAIKLEKYH